jgi:hypothetical protein
MTPNSAATMTTEPTFVGLINLDAERISGIDKGSARKKICCARWRRRIPLATVMARRPNDATRIATAIGLDISIAI